jgi:hypothetical protein
MWRIVTVLALAVLGAPSALAQNNTPRLIAECDRLAASDQDGARPPAVRGVPVTAIDAKAAVAACLAAAKAAPGEARIIYQLGRALEADKKLDNAIASYQLADQLGYAIAAAALGELYERGEGVPRDAGAAERLYAKAAQAGDCTGADDLQRLRGGLTGTWNEVCCSGKYRQSLELVQTQSQITGSWANGASITGSRSGNAVQLSDSAGFKFALTLSADGKKIAGTLDGPRDTSVGNDIELTRVAAPALGSANADILGTKWLVNDAGWTGIWTRRASSNMFDAVWTLDKQRVEAELAFSLKGTHVEIRRTDTKVSAGTLGSSVYSGDWNGTHWSGTNLYKANDGQQFGPYVWAAIPRGVSPQSDAAPADRLGSQWLTVEGGWSGVWIRRGASNLFEAIWTLGGSRIEAQLSIALQGDRVEINRVDTKSTVGLSSCTYSGRWNGTSWNGTNMCTVPEGGSFGPYEWTAVVR